MLKAVSGRLVGIVYLVREYFAFGWQTEVSRRLPSQSCFTLSGSRRSSSGIRSFPAADFIT